MFQQSLQHHAAISNVMRYTCDLTGQNVSSGKWLVHFFLLRLCQGWRKYSDHLLKPAVRDFYTNVLHSSMCLHSAAKKKLFRNKKVFLNVEPVATFDLTFNS